MVYEYIVGKNGNHPFGDSTFIDSIHGWQHHTTVLQVNRQIRDEALNILYKQNIFTVCLCVNGPIVAKASYATKKGCCNIAGRALRWGWDISLIVHLRIGIQVFELAEWSETLKVLGAIEYTALPLMKNLRTLRLFIVTIRGHAPADINGTSSVWNEHIDGNGVSPNGTAQYRQMMCKFARAVGKDVKVNFGLDEWEEK